MSPSSLTSKERMPLTGFRLWRWKTALRIYSFGCWVSGRHEYLYQFDEDWKVWYCPHCGWAEDHDD